jgi:hypothetical protein
VKRRRAGSNRIASAARRPLGALVDVDVVPPFLPEDRAAVADHFRIGHVGDDPVDAKLVRHVGDRELHRLVEERRALGSVGHDGKPLVELVHLRQLEARHVLAADLVAVVARERAEAVGAGGGRADRPHHELAGARGLQILRPLRVPERDAKADRVHVLLEELLDLALRLVGLGGDLEQQRRSVGALAPAVAVAVDVAVQVEQALCARRIVFAELAAKRGLVVVGEGNDRRLGDDRLPLPQDADLARRVHRQADRASQRDVGGLVAADHRAFHVEERLRRSGLDLAIAADALLREVGRDLAARHRRVDELEGDALDEVGAALQERQPARLLLLDDRDLDTVDHRQPPAPEAGEQRLALGVVGGRLGVVEHLAKLGVSLHDDEGAAAPLDEPERAGADRVAVDLLAVVLDHLARDCAEQVAGGQPFRKARPRLAEPDLERVAVEGAQALDLAVVVERPLAVERRLAQLGQSEVLLGLEARPDRALVGRVGEALERIHVVLRDQLAALPLEGRIALEVDPGLDANRPDAKVGRRLGRPRGRQRLDLDRPREMVVLVERFEDVRRERARIEVDDLDRIQARLGDPKRVAQHLLAVGGHRAARCLRQRRQRRRQRRRGERTAHAPAIGAKAAVRGPLHRARLAFSARSMSTYFQNARRKTLRWKPTTHGCARSVQMRCTCTL